MTLPLSTGSCSRLFFSALIAAGVLLQGCSDNNDSADTTDAPLAEQAPAAAEQHDHHHQGGDAQDSNALPRSSAPEDASVSFVSPANGSTVTSPVQFEFALEGMTVVPAGEQQDNAGHHHLLINLDTLPEMGFPLPANDQVIHFGAGQTETELELAPGTYRLQLLLGDHYHIPHQPPVLSEVIEITVE